MKKSILFLLAFLTMGGAAKAQTISVADVEALPGETVAFSVDLTGGKDTKYTAFQFDVQFPATGFTTTGAYTVSSSWTGASATVGSVDGTGLATIPFASANEIQGTDVEGLVTVSFKVDESVALGEYDVTLKNIFLAYNTSDKDYPADVTFKVKVVDRITLDENSKIVPMARNDVNVKVIRTINANEWSTICLPFEMTKEQVQNIFGSDVKVYYFDSYETTKDGDNITAITVNFEEEDFSANFTKNYPYIIKTTKKITEFNLDNVDIDPDAIDQDYTTGSGKNKKTLGHFYGTFVANTIVPENNLFLADGKFYYSKGLTKMKAFRCYFDFNDVISSVEGASAPVFFSFDNDITGIKNIQRTAEDGKCYNLGGQRVVSPKKGLYIKNGKKVVVK